MALQQNTAEGQSAGTVLSTANSGGASGNAFGTTSTGNVTFSNTQSAHGNSAYAIVADTTASVYAGLVVTSGVSAAAARYYLYLNSYPTAAVDALIQIRSSSGRAATLGITTAGRLTVYNNAGVIVQTAPTANPVPLGTWVRIELSAVVGTGTTDGTIAVAFYPFDSSTATWSYSASNLNTGTALITEARFGKANTGGTIDGYMDDLGFNDGATTFIGPANPTNQAPVAVAGANQTVVTGTTVTLNGSGSSDADGSITTYTWSQVSGAAVSLSGSGASRTFTAPSTPATLVFSLTVTDNAGAASDPSNVTITVGAAANNRLLLTNTAEGGANGAAISSVSNQASGSGTNFDTVTVGTGGALTYTTDQAVVGSTSYKMVQGTGSIVMGWTTSLASSAPINDFVFQGYVYLTAAPSVVTVLYKGYADTAYTPSMAAWAVTINTSLQIVVQNATTSLYTLSPALALNTWYRIEGEFVASTSSQVKVSVGTSSTVYASGASSVFSANATVSVRQGIGTASSGIGTVYFDDFSAAVGPGYLTDSVSSNQPPSASAGSDQSIEPWATATLTGTDSDADGTVVSRSWTQLSGSPSVTLSGSGAVQTYTAPPTLDGTALVFGYQVTDNGGASSAQDQVTHTIYPVNERAVIGGAEVPMRLDVV